MRFGLLLLHAVMWLVLTASVALAQEIGVVSIDEESVGVGNGATRMQGPIVAGQSRMATAPEIQVSGNNRVITDGDTSPSSGDKLWCCGYYNR